MNKATYDLYGHKKTIYAPNTEPEKFFTDVMKIKRHGSSERPPKGHKFIWDHRVNDEFQRWGKPTELAEECAQDYPLGQGFIANIEIIEWKDGNVLTILKTSAENGFQFDFWAGLNVSEKVA